MAKVLIPIANGTEEIEAVTIIDVLRRADIEVTVASAEERLKVIASRGVEITADCHLPHCQNKPWDMVVIPGGVVGSERLAANPILLDILNDQVKAERWLAAICAAPALVLAEQGLIKGASATCYPAFRARMEAQHVHVMGQDVVEYRNLVTSRGPGTAMAFAMTLVKVLKGGLKANEVADAMIFNGF